MSNDLALADTQSFISLIERLAKDSTVDTSKLSAILDIQERIINKRAEAEFNEAFQRLRDKLPIIKKGDIVEYPVNKNNPDGPKKEAFKFAKWEKVQAIIDDIIAEEGFDLTFDSEVHTNGSSVVAILHHKGGHTRRTSTPPLPMDTGGGKNNIQGIGSSMSYGQRYATKFALNLRFEDDDDGVKAGIKFIDADSVKMVNNLLTETKTDKARFLQFMEAAEVENIQAKDLPKAVNALMKKKAKS